MQFDCHAQQSVFNCIARALAASGSSIAAAVDYQAQARI